MDRKALYVSIGAYLLMLGVSLSFIANGYDHIPNLDNHEMQFKFLSY